MAKYLRPRRGSKANAVAQKILLKKGEMFMEFPNSEIGKGPGRIIMGDGATSYQNMDYGTTATNVFRPFITDPEIFIPHFSNTNPSTASWTVDAGTAAIAKMGDGSSASTVALPTIIGAVKETLCKHADSITKLNNDLDDANNILSKLGTFYTFTWLANSSSSFQAELTNRMNLPKGSYILIGVAPIISVDSFSLKLYSFKPINNTFEYVNVSTRSPYAYTFQVLEDNTEIVIVSGGSVSTTFSNIDQAGARAIRLSTW